MLKCFSGETVTDDCIITSIPKSTLEWTENKVKYFYQMTPQEYNEYVKDYLNMVDKYRAYQSKNCSNSNDYALALSKTNTEVKKVLSKKYKQKYEDKAQKTNND